MKTEVAAEKHDCYATDITSEANAAFDEGRADVFGDIARAAKRLGLTHKTAAPEKSGDLVAFAVAILRFSGVRQAADRLEREDLIDRLRCERGNFETEAAQLRAECRRLQAALARKAAAHG